MDKEFINDLSETANVQCICAGMGMGKTFALRKFIKNLPADKRICILSSSISSLDSTDGGFEEVGVKLNHYKVKDNCKLYKCKRFSIQMESLYKIGAENSACNKGGE